MSELSSEVPVPPLFTPEDQAIIEAERVKLLPGIEVDDMRLLKMHRIVHQAARVGAKATIESDGN